MKTDKKNKILVIAPTLPYYDKESGSKRLFAILNILSVNYEIHYISDLKSRKTEGIKYINELEQMGIKVYFRENKFREIMSNNIFTAAFLEFYFIAEYYLPRIRILQKNCLIIVDSVDVHYYRLFSKFNITKSNIDYIEASTVKKRELSIYGKADLVLTVTNEDMNILLKDCSELKIDIIPNIHEIHDNNELISDKNALIFVGGFYHKPNVDAILYFSKEIMPLLIQRNPSIKLFVIGTNIPEEIKKISNENIEIIGYVPSVTPYLQKSYISIAPLRYGAGMKGKIGEAMAHGIPVVTTSIGVQGLDLKHREDIMIADTPEDFVNSIFQLINDEVLYKKLSTNSINYIKNNFTIQQISPKLQEVLCKNISMPIKKFSLKEKVEFFSKYIFFIFKNNF